MPTSGYWNGDGPRGLPAQPVLTPSPRYANPFAAAPARPVFDPPPNLPPLVAPEADAPEEPKPRRRSTRPILLVVLVAAIAAAVVAYPTASSEPAPVPPALRAYVAGHGVHYAPGGQGYSVRLPSAAVHRDGPATAMPRKLSLKVRRSIVSGTGFEIIIRMTILPTVGVLTNGLGGAPYDPTVGGSLSATHVQRVTFLGRTAYDFDLGLRTGPPIHGRVFLVQHRLYTITVQSNSVLTVFNALVRSFRLTAPRR
jgi:hypothetical protein